MTAKGDYGTTWRKDITDVLVSRFALNVVNPCIVGKGDSKEDQVYFRQLIKERNFPKVKNDFYRVIRKDLREVDKADFLIFNHDPHVPTIGTIHEIIIACDQKKPTIVLCREELVDDINPWLLTLIKPQWLHTTIDSMVTYLDKIDATTDINKLDTSWWWM
jgi:hypothetical protein